jgi:hypothetical protein
MTHTVDRFSLAAVLLLLAGPLDLYGLSYVPAARQFTCDVTQGETGPDWLIARRPAGKCGTLLPLCRDGCTCSCTALDASSTRSAQSGVGGSSTAGGSSVWKQVGVCGLEFVGGSTGTALAAIVPAIMLTEAMKTDFDKWQLGVAAFPTYVVSSILLSATGTHLTGRILHQKGTFRHALVGGLIGALCGGVAAYCSLSPGRAALLPVGLLAPSVCSVFAYNVWRDDETE